MNNVRQPRTINASAGKLLSQVLVKVFEEVSDEDVKAAFSNRLNDDRNEMCVTLLKTKEPESVLAETLTEVFNKLIDMFRNPETNDGRIVKGWLEDCVAVSVTFKSKGIVDEVRFVLGDQTREEEIDSAFTHPDDIIEYRLD